MGCGGSMPVEPIAPMHGLKGLQTGKEYQIVMVDSVYEAMLEQEKHPTPLHHPAHSHAHDPVEDEADRRHAHKMRSLGHEKSQRQALRLQQMMDDGEAVEAAAALKIQAVGG